MANSNGNSSKVIKAVGFVDKLLDKVFAAPTVKLLVIGLIALAFYLVYELGNDVVEVMKDNNAKITNMVISHEERLTNAEKVIADLANRIDRLEDSDGE